MWSPFIVIFALACVYAHVYVAIWGPFDPVRIISTYGDQKTGPHGKT